MDRKGAVPFNPNLLNNKARLGIAMGLLAIGGAACNTIDQAFAYPDYPENPVLREMQLEAASDEARRNQQSTPEPNYSAEQTNNNELPGLGISCQVINPDETVSHVLEQMGLWPSENAIQGGISPSVAVYRDGSLITDPVAITDALGGNTAVDKVQVGDEVCIGNPSDLIRRPTPTPQSLMPKKFQLSQAGFSPSKGSQPARPATLRRA